MKNWWWLLVVLGVVCMTGLRSYPGPTAPDGAKPAITYAKGIVHVSIPYEARIGGMGLLRVEIVDPEDHVLGQSERRVDAVKGNGHWHQDLTLASPLAPNEFACQRLRYRFAFDSQEPPIEGTEAVSRILLRPVVHLIAQQSYLSGAQAAVRVIVTDSKNQPIPGEGSVRIELSSGGFKARPLFTGRLNARGTTEAQFVIPAALRGNASLRYVAETPIGEAEFTQPVHVEDKAAILLTTEKPVYQPGQTIHVRALALDRANHAAFGNRKLTFEVEDSRGNKVFKKGTQTDKFGVASAEFELADEVNLGTYHLRAVISGGEATENRAELALQVERYVLPKFNVAIEFDGQRQHARHGYRPGDHVTGTVHANYFFGKPVDGAEIEVQAAGIDVAESRAASQHGKTSAAGDFHFDLRLPDYFAGGPLSQGAAAVLIEATVKDAAAHSETRGDPITVSESPLTITAIPEGGQLIPNLENQIFVITAYPDGTPAVSNVKIRAEGGFVAAATTDEGGVAQVKLHAAKGREDLRIEATDKDGNHVSRSVQIEARPGATQILLRTERAVYRAGDRIALHLFSTRTRGAAYVDVVKNGQTVLTRDLDIVNGQAELSLVATPDLSGTVDIHAYQFGADAAPVGDHRLIFVQPADELKIEANADLPQYKPGDEARIRFRVTNSHGEGVQAALGLQVVDQAVFALAEKQPGMAKVFFYLAQEAMKPRYEIHSLGLPEIADEVPPPLSAQHQRAARALFAATEMVNENQFETAFGRAMDAAKYNEYVERYVQQYRGQLGRLAESLTRAYASSGGDLTKLAASLSGPAMVEDAWGNHFRVEHASWDRHGSLYEVRSAGPDKVFGSADDMIAYLELRGPRAVAEGSTGPSRIELNVEHDRGPMNGRGEITGSVADQRGGAIEGATVTAKGLLNGATRSTRVNAAGRFDFAGLPEGEYEVKVSNGSASVYRRITLMARDRAVVSTTLRQESGARVVVTDMQPRRFEMDGFRNVARDFVQGAIAGMPQMIFPKAKMAMVAVPAPPPLPVGSAAPISSASALKTEPAAPAAHIRSYFPEALYINPEIVTDRNGEASITIRMADSITTWRMAMLASTMHGALGSNVASLRVMQEFFVDLDLPVTLTQGDRVSIPVAVYNYSAVGGNVHLEMKNDPWFRLADDRASKDVAVEAGRVGASQFTIEAQRIGKFKLTIAARMDGGNNPADVVVREIEVIPNGREQSVVFNGRLETDAAHDVDFPPTAIADASKIFVRLYPGPLSQVVEGMDAILRMPHGCFEQTSSATYPNVLALDYMKKSKKLTPEIHAKAEGFIANGYQRLLSFEVPGGGFSWFGNAPANKILTAYGLMEFSDLSQVHEIDRRVIERTQNWLAAQQQPDGSWKPDQHFINEGATNRFNSDVLRITAYLGWALRNSGYQGPAADRAKEYVVAHMTGKADAYTLAVAANFAADYGRDREFTRRAMQLLLDARIEKDEQTWWTADETGVYGGGVSAAIETTGLAVQALLKWGEASNTSGKALRYIAAKKDASGTWGSTQATIMALRALLLSTEKGAADVRGTAEVSLDGKLVERLVLTPDNNDLLHQFGLPVTAKAHHRVALHFDGKGGLAYQVSGQYFVPWNDKPANEPLSIEIAYDRTHLAQNDIATATATVKNNLNKPANMVMIDLGIPPGFDLLTEDLQEYQEKSASRKSGRMEKFNLTATQAILYFDSIAGGDTVTLHYRLRAKYPIRARTFESRVYEYYDPAVSAIARPAALEVTRR